MVPYLGFTYHRLFATSKHNPSALPSEDSQDAEPKKVPARDAKTERGRGGRRRRRSEEEGEGEGGEAPAPQLARIRATSLQGQT